MPDTPAAAPDAPAPDAPIVSIKGFDADLKCRDFQFEIGKTYEVAGAIRACENGFHACPTEHHPLSVFDYYAPAGNRFCEVTQDGARHVEGDKLASAKITIGVELSLGDLAQRAVKWVFDRAKWSEGAVAKGDNEGATASGWQGAATASGWQGAATASGWQGAATASGTRSAATASGWQGAATASGWQGAATASGWQGAATASGDQGAATASGDQGAATASGWQGAATASGANSVATAAGEGGRVRGIDGAALFAVERGLKGAVVSVAAGIVGRDGIKAATWYRCEGGRLVEIEAVR